MLSLYALPAVMGLKLRHICWEHFNYNIDLGKSSRGLASFTSILKKFGLKDRLIFSPSQLNTELINSQVNFVKVNQLKTQQQQLAQAFLNRALTHSE